MVSQALVGSSSVAEVAAADDRHLTVLPDDLGFVDAERLVFVDPLAGGVQ